MRGIVTPEAVVLEFETASVGSRALAQAIDLGVRFGLLLAVAMVLGPLEPGITGTGAVVILTIVAFLLIFGYPAACEAWWNGQTVGKRAVGLRVVTVEGAPIGFRQAAIRAMLFLVDVVVPPLGVVATISVLLSPNNQRLGDVFAGTIVLRERTGAAPPVPVSFPPLPGYEDYARSLDVGALTPEQYALVRSFLIRVNHLAPEARAHLGRQLADHVRRIVRPSPPPNVAAEPFLVSVAAAYQLRQGGAGGAPPMAAAGVTYGAPAPPPPPPGWRGR